MNRKAYGSILVLAVLSVQCSACGPAPRQLCVTDSECLACERCIDGDCTLDESRLNACGECDQPEPEELCDDGLDNDCDGETDEACEDVCRDVVCDSPPDSGCIDGSTRRVFIQTGVCVEGQCRYEHADVFCPQGCEDGFCLGDPCTGVICDSPPGPCYQSTGTCHNGACQYLPLDGEACDDENPCTLGDACLQGRCSGASITCDSPPAATCRDDDTVYRYDSVGACTEGICVYQASEYTCSQGCQDGQCQGEPCEGIVCDNPPNGCYQTQGTCSDGICHYAFLDGTACLDADPCTTDDRCTSGICQGTAVICDQPPANTCMNDTTLVSYSASGACTDGTCSYPPTETICSFGCSGGLCTGDPCAGQACDQPPEDGCIDDTTLRRYEASGVCEEGSCVYGYLDTDCEEGCQDAACLSAGATLWSRSLSHTDSDRGRRVAITAEGSIVALGETSAGWLDNDAWVIWMDPHGNVEQSYRYSFGYGVVRDFSLDPDGSLALLKYGVKTNLARLDETGQTVWAKSYSLDSKAVLRLADGYLLAGDDDHQGTSVGTLVKISNGGLIDWSSNFSPQGLEGTFFEVVKVGDGFVAVGYLWSESIDGWGWVVKTDPLGQLEWQVALKEAGHSRGACRLIAAGQNAAGNIMVAGWSGYRDTDGNWDRQDGLLAGITNAGSVLWKKTYDAGKREKFSSIWVGATGAVLGGNAGDRALLVKVDSQGQVEWQRNLGGMSAEVLSVVPTADGGTVAAIEESLVFIYQGFDLIRIDSGGEIPSCEFQGYDSVVGTATTVQVQLTPVDLSCSLTSTDVTVNRLAIPVEVVTHCVD